MPPWGRPELPEGPLRDLNDELHRLHAFSGHRSANKIADWLAARAESDPDFPPEWKTPSHTWIHRILKRPELPNRATMISVVEAFISLGRIPAGREVLDNIDRLWTAAYEEQAAAARKARAVAKARAEREALAAELAQLPSSAEPEYPAADRPGASGEAGVAVSGAVIGDLPLVDAAADEQTVDGDLAGTVEPLRRPERKSNSGWPIDPLPGEPPLTLFRGKELRELPVGSELDRFGGPAGNLTYAAGTPFAERSLVPEWVNRPYHVYRLQRPLEALTGVAIPWFSQPGGGSAYLLPASIGEMLAAGDLIELDPGEPPIDLDQDENVPEQKEGSQLGRHRRS